MNKWGVYRLFEATQMVPSTHATQHITSAFLGMLQEKIWPGPEKSKNILKTTKIEGYNTRFGIFPRSSSEHQGMPPRGMGGHWNVVMWLGTNIWMHFRSFWHNFRFHEKWTNEVFRGFSRQQKWCQAPVQRNMSRRLSYKPWDFKWLETNICMSLRSFWGNFGFHEKWTNVVFRDFSRQRKWCQVPTQH